MKNTTVIKLSQLNIRGRKANILNQLISITNRLKIQKKVLFVILPLTFQIHIIICIALAIKLNNNTAHINVIIAINFLQVRKDRKDT